MNEKPPPSGKELHYATQRGCGHWAPIVPAAVDRPAPAKTGSPVAPTPPDPVPPA